MSLVPFASKFLITTRADESYHSSLALRFFVISFGSKYLKIANIIIKSIIIDVIGLFFRCQPAAFLHAEKVPGILHGGLVAIVPLESNHASYIAW